MKALFHQFALTMLLTVPLAGLWAQAPAAPAATPPAASPTVPPKFKDYIEVIKGTERFDGLFTLYRTNDTLYAEIKPPQFDQPFIAPMAIARGMALAGMPLNFGDEWILVFRRVGDKIQLLRRNIYYKAPDNTPLQKAVKQNYTDSVLMALPIVTINPGSQGVVIDFSQIFLSDFAELGIGSIDRNRTSFSKIKTFANNIEMEVEATFSGRGGYGYLGDSGVADSRGLTLVIHYSLARLPDASYKPRYADYRVGHFLNATKDFGSDNPDTSFVRMINRWRLEKSDPKAKLSPPKKQVVWWVEDTVPQEYRPFVEEGILEWNKAFEKIGFKNALAVRWQNERDEFDPEDINYCTFRWITTSSTFAMSALRSNPLTGEMIDGDVIFDASWIRAWKTEYAFLVGNNPAGQDGETFMPLDVGEIISPMLAAKSGFGLAVPFPPNRAANLAGGRTPGAESIDLVPAQSSPWQRALSRRMAPGKFTACQYVSSKHFELSLAAMALAAGGTNTDMKLPEEFMGQAIKEVVMHEVGHSLGLRHNFKASTMLSLDQLNDPAVTRVKGMSGSVMDYNPINIAAKGEKQGDYASTTIGPYDYWAIEYAYKQIDGDEKEELTKIAARSPDTDLTFGTDEDMYLSDDPRINVYDMSNDPLKYGQQRIALAAGLLKDLDSRIVKDGESWQRLRRGFSVLLAQYGNGAYLAANYIGGQFVSRDFKSEKGQDPVIPVTGERQREALKYVVDEILSDKSFKFSPALLRRLTTENWYHWGAESMGYYGGMDFRVYDRILAIQRIVLNQCFNAGILGRIQNQELQSDANSKPLRLSEVFSTLTDGIWSELNNGDDTISTIRRNLQREHLRRLCTMVVGNRRSAFEEMYGYVVFLGSVTVPADAKSLARMHLSDLGERIGKALTSRGARLDDTTKAHLAECKQRIAKTLDSSYTSNEF
ncbi:MAG: DUF5117 domain-containing protein [Pedosphaera sp.]|nr:DUF5117 domain-containing protein [Pedosphaera sp.]